MPRTPFAPLLALLLLACGSEAEPPIPEMPSFATDVRPILEKHCTRCHNETLSGDTNPMTGGLDRPSLCHLNRFESTGDCSDTGISTGACSLGAEYCGTKTGDPPSSYISTFVSIAQDEGGMPPPPAAPLSAREKEIILRWTSADPAP